MRYFIVSDPTTAISGYNVSSPSSAPRVTVRARRRATLRVRAPSPRQRPALWIAVAVKFRSSWKLPLTWIGPGACNSEASSPGRRETPTPRLSCVGSRAAFFVPQLVVLITIARWCPRFPGWSSPNSLIPAPGGQSIIALAPSDRGAALDLLQSPLFNLASDLFCPRLIKYLLCDREQFLFLVAHMFADKVP
jgi:hypothetical protein